MRVVLDTNIIVSAILFRGAAEPVFLAFKSKKFIFLASGEMIMEYCRVLAYPKFKLSEQEIKVLWEEEILPFITPIQVSSVKAVIKDDPADDIFLACAKFGKADYLVTGDRHLLDLKSYGKTKIIPLREFLSLLQEPKS